MEMGRETDRLERGKGGGGKKGRKWVRGRGRKGGEASRRTK